MILGALLALQLAAAGQTSRPANLVVHDARRSVDVPLVMVDGAPMLRPQSLSPVLPITVGKRAGGDWSLSIGDVVFDLKPGAPVVRVGGVDRQLVVAPILRDGRLYVPLQLVSELVPSFVPNTRWDAPSGQLVVFSSIAASKSTRNRERARDERAARSSAGDVEAIAAKRVVAQETPLTTRLRHTIVVDAGHGGPDRGMNGPIGSPPSTRIYEKEITLAVAKRLGAALAKRGMDVVYTRTTDTLIALADRGRIANQANGDLFISVHVNAANPNWRDPAAARGFETYFLSEARTEDAKRVEAMENDAVRFENAPDSLDKDDPLGFILSDMRQNEHLRESSELADLIQQRLTRVEPGPNRGVKQAGFKVLVTAFMPSVLVEIGFGTNPRDAAFISSPSKQDEIANAVADAAMEYLQRYERRIAGPTQ